MPVRFDHSIGIVLIDGRYLLDSGNFSFRVGRDGEVTELHGWGARGGHDAFLPPGWHSEPTAPPDLGVNGPTGDNYHTCFVEAPVTRSARQAILGLLVEHRQRYGGEGRAWAWPPWSALAVWVGRGMVDR